MSPVPQKQKKNLTYAQRKRRHNIKRVIFYTSCVLILLLIIFGLFKLIQFGVSALKKDDVPPASEISVESERSEFGDQNLPNGKVELMAVGDNLIHNTVYEYAEMEDGTYDFTPIYSFLREEIATADLACIQQETIFINDPAQYSNYPAFGTPTDMADSLSAVGFDVICHASNHTYDKIEAGVFDTINKWKEHPEVTVLGIHESQEDADTVKIVEKNGIKIAMFNYTYGLNYAAPNDPWLIDFIDDDHEEAIKNQLSAAKTQADIIVVFMHMGDENALKPSEDQKKWAQFFADNGVGLVIGTHSHSVQPVEVYQGINGNEMPIFYSLGNFVSSQKETVNMLGAMAKATIVKDETGTYVSDYSIDPLVTWIRSGSGKGAGYIFHTLPLEEYTTDMAALHIRSNCLPDDFKSVWTQIFETDNYYAE